MIHFLKKSYPSVYPDELLIMLLEKATTGKLEIDVNGETYKLTIDGIKGKFKEIEKNIKLKLEK